MKNKFFYFLLIGQFFSYLADVFFIVALISIVFHLTHSTVVAGLVPIFRVSAGLLSGMVAPLIIDRYNPLAVLKFSNLLQSILFLVLAICSLYPIKQIVVIPFFLILTFLLSFFEGWAAPIRNSLVPNLVDKNELLKANSLLSTLDQSVQLMGWFLGGYLVVFVGDTKLLWVTFIFSILSSMLFFSLKNQVVFGSVKQKAELEAQEKRPWNSLKEGWETIWRLPTIRAIFLMDFLEGLVNAVWIAAILFVYVRDVLHKGEEWWGFINASFFLGGIVGGTAIVALGRYTNSYLRFFIIFGAFTISIMTFVFGIVSNPIFALVLSFILGAVTQLRDTAQQTILQESTPEGILPKVFAAKATMMYATFGISVLFMGIITDVFGVKSTYVVAATFIGIAGLSAIFQMKPVFDRSAG
ncbi:MFS transporter [Brevibacillus composti]|uniref:MFS transporter n=1 Tax=Brevibacillus composti TaxID=2796470 RepID=A0A7T5JQ23_9BACL|nr:MFS transporter [Brevibacillus composti]QQE76033.1 MFS transporter [Brevibacillus composti]QUO43061.1 MFS transporter [Brevibacillus composti]